MKEIIFVTVVSLICRVIGRGTWSVSGQYEYYVSPGGDSRPYDEAQAYCNGQGGELALVKTQEVQQFIQTLVADNSGQPYGFFIGLRDIGANGTFVWNDGEALSYTNWNTGEPNSIDQICVIMGWIYTYQANLPWYDIPCTTGANGPRGFLCQRLVGTTPNKTTIAMTSLTTATSAPAVQSQTTHGNIIQSTVTNEELTTNQDVSEPAVQTQTTNGNLVQSTSTKEESINSTPNQVSDSTTVASCSCFASEASSCDSGFAFEPISFIIGLLIPTIIFVAVSVKFYLIYKKFHSKLSQPQQEVRHYESIKCKSSTVQQSSSQEASRQYENILHKPTGSSSDGTNVNNPKTCVESTYEQPINTSRPEYVEFHA